MKFTRKNRRAELLWVGAVVAAVAGVSLTTATVPTTVQDFFAPGTQPGELNEFLIDSGVCWYCHGNYHRTDEPFNPWAASMMGQAARDPVFWACLTIANQDAAFAGEFCIRCHVPVAWYHERSLPPDGSALIGADFDGISCVTCHRMVDPVFRPGMSPPIDEEILANLQHPPIAPGNNTGVIDPLDRRRGPRDLGPNFFFHEWAQSPFHLSSNMCGTCHEVSNPILSRQPNGDYIVNMLDEPHPTQNKYDMFPLDRTFSEWKMSAFAQGPIDMGGRFGGNTLLVSSCQDCHMPTANAHPCNPIFGQPARSDYPQHFFTGGNSWVLRAIRNLYPDEETGLSAESVEDSIARAAAMVAAASDMELSIDSGRLKVRVINQTGHKLPTGYHEGRRIWINVRFLDSDGQPVLEHGGYDFDTAVLDASTTKVYESKQGLDEYMANLTGKPQGESFHQAISNKIFKDNRIPPRGFSNAGFASVQAEPVNYNYEDGQYWDDTYYDLPAGAVRAAVKVYYQTTSKEYIEFLRDENHTDDRGEIAYNQWVATGRSAPVVMDDGVISLCPADFNNDGQADFFDYLDFIAAFAAEDPSADFNGDGQVDFFDYLDFISAFAEGCP